MAYVKLDILRPLNKIRKNQCQRHLMSPVSLLPPYPDPEGLLRFLVLQFLHTAKMGDLLQQGMESGEFFYLFSDIALHKYTSKYDKNSHNYSDKDGRIFIDKVHDRWCRIFLPVICIDGHIFPDKLGQYADQNGLLTILDASKRFLLIHFANKEYDGLHNTLFPCVIIVG